MVEKAGSMDKSTITTLALNILSTDSMIRSTGIHIPEMKQCILCKQNFTIYPDGLEGYLLNMAKDGAKLTCPN